MKRILHHLLNLKVGFEDEVELENSILVSKIIEQYQKNPDKKTICVRIDDQTREVLDKLVEDDNSN